jgi:hypothetical protein
MTPQIKKKKKHLYLNTADFQLKKRKKKRKKKKKRRKNKIHDQPLVLQHPWPVSSLIFSLVFHINPVTFKVIKWL